MEDGRLLDDKTKKGKITYKVRLSMHTYVD